MIPTLTTERLVLRGPEARDYPAFEACFATERSRYIGGPLPAPKAWRAFAAQVGHWHIRGFGMWTVTARGSDEPLGLVGCWFPGGWPEREIGWLVWPEAEGRGIAGEAARAARAHAYGTLGWTTAVSYIDPANARSIALARRIGCAEDPDAGRPDPATLVFRHPAPEAAR